MLCSLLRLSSGEQTFPPVSVFLRALAGAERFPVLALRSREPPQLLGRGCGRLSPLQPPRVH